MGCKDWFTAKVRTNGELEAAMHKASEVDSAAYIEIVGAKHDYPPAAKLLHSRMAALYGI
jgi:indolepyruvate decarboxylase